MIICPANAEDAPSIAALGTLLGSKSAPEAVRRTLVEILEDRSHAVFVCDDEATGVLGWIHVQKTVRLQSPTIAEIAGMVVE